MSSDGCSRVLQQRDSLFFFPLHIQKVDFHIRREGGVVALAGKTTVLRHLLQNAEGLKIGCVVNDVVTLRDSSNSI